MSGDAVIRIAVTEVSISLDRKTHTLNAVGSLRFPFPLISRLPLRRCPVSPNIFRISTSHKPFLRFLVPTTRKAVGDCLMQSRGTERVWNRRFWPWCWPHLGRTRHDKRMLHFFYSQDALTFVTVCRIRKMDKGRPVLNSLYTTAI